ncbi:hypothetical protein PCANC_23436 [Puccinia coronata f. sp. avenae]|uniref:Ima1 N-terminal domain-containing protein n=1 Tax=Puccinia coronata f. sp. avenae TaxID=200324 RepID=A0A2N5SGG7_9BASI|nr:hypothetical protein PCANC_23436 [Puccinia coronata f. sp. avenae]
MTVSKMPKSFKNAASSPDSPSSPFCSTCLANQNLHLNLLANYLPGDADLQNPHTRADLTTSTRELLNNLPAYRASLEARYPILCSACSLKASEIIKERNYKVKAFSLNESVKRLVEPFQSRLNPTGLSSQNPPLHISGMGGSLWTLQEWMWRFQGVGWLSCYLASISVALYSSFIYPRKLQILTPESAPSPTFLGLPMVLTYCMLELGCTLFDFTWARVRKNRAQGIRTKVIGKRWFVCLNVVACLLRLFLWFYVCGTGTNEHAVEHIFDGSDSSGSLIFGGIAAALIALLVASLNVLHTDSPIGMKSLPHSKARSLAQSTLKPTPGLAEHELFSTLSLARPPSSYSTQIVNLQNAENEAESHTGRVSAEPKFGELTSLQTPFNESSQASSALSRSTIEEGRDTPMDWEPSPDPDFHSNNILLRPQTFPHFREETGIEDLFQTKAKLVESDDSDTRPAGWFKNLLSLKSAIKKE